jgi:hypothetical protein
MASTLPDDPETLLTREAVAAALTDAGYPTSPKTLATKASRGGGPPFRKWSNRPLYAWGSALAWARSRLGPVVTSTAELDALTLGRSQARSSTRAIGQGSVPPANQVTRSAPRQRARRESQL